MPTIIDSLVVELGLDPRDFQANQKKITAGFKKWQDEVKQQQADLEHQVQESADAMDRLLDRALELFAVFTAGRGMKDFFFDTVQSTAAVGRLSYQFDESAKDLATWRNAAEQTGGSADDLTDSIGSLTNDLQNWVLRGESQTLPYFRALNIHVSDTNGKIKTATQLFKEINRAVQGMDPAKARAIIAGLGLGQSAANLLLMDPKRLDAILSAARKNAPTADDIKRAQDFQKAWAQMLQTSEATGRSIITTLEPALDGLLTQHVQPFFDYLRTHKEAAQGTFTAVSGAVGLLSAAIGVRLVKAIAVDLLTALRTVNGFLVGTPIGWLLLAGYSAYQVYEFGKRVAGEIGAGQYGKAGYDFGTTIGGAITGVEAPDYDELAKKLSTNDNAPLKGLSLFRGKIGGGGGYNTAAGLLPLIRRLENSGDRAVSRAGAIGRNQILPSTASLYGFDPLRLTDPAYNDMVATAILSDLLKVYHGDATAAVAAYNTNPKRAGQFYRSGDRDYSALLPETRNYLARAARYTGGAVGGSGGTHIDNLNVYSQAKDAAGIAKDIRRALERNSYAAQANSGAS